MKHARSFLIVAVAGLALLPSSASAGDRGHRGRVVVVASRGSVAVAFRSSRPATDEVRTDHQPQDRQGARPSRSPSRSCCGRIRWSS